MADPIGFGVRLYGYNMEDWIFTFAAATDIITLHNAATTSAVGRLVELDVTAAGTVKLATDDSTVLGRIESVEQRKQEGTQLVAVAIKFSQYLPKTTNAAITIGTSVQGGGSGLVKTLAADGNTLVLETAIAAADQVLVMKF